MRADLQAELGRAMSGVVYTPPPDHECTPPRSVGSLPATGHDYPAGTVWECDCGTTWVSLGITGGGQQRGGGYAAGGLEWKRESKRARRRRERQGISGPLHLLPARWRAG